MLYLAYISFLFLGFQLINVIINFLAIQKLKGSLLNDKRSVSVLIPARNEEVNIKSLLEDLQKINHNILEILVFNDQSTDATAQVVESFSAIDNRILLIQSSGLPEGWMGKNHACYQLAKEAKGNQLLFLDADVRIHGSLIGDAVAYLIKKNLSLLSIFPIQILKSFGEKASVPIMNFVLLTLLPLIFVRKSPFSSHAAANGQFMLFDDEHYSLIQPHKLLKDSYVEDIAIAQYYKKQKLKIACLTGDRRIQCRMYTSYFNAVKGFSKNVFMFFGNSPVTAFVFWLLATLGFIPVLMALPEYFIWFILSTLIILVSYSIISKQNVLQNVFLFIVHMLFLFHAMVHAILVKTRKKHLWKERNIFF